MSGLRVLIVGASIAGPTAAYWFAKAGASVTVVERFPSLRTNGQNIDIRGVGVSVMRRTPGMEPAVRSKLAPMQGITLIGPGGKPVGTITPTGNPDQQSLISEYEILRGDLSRILYDLSDNDHPDNVNVRYVFGETIAGITQPSGSLGGPVTVEFANGRLLLTEFDLVVAADGATSRTRALALGCSVRDYMRPVNAWAAFFTILQDHSSEDLLDGSSLGHAYTAVGGRFVAVAPLTGTESSAATDPSNTTTTNSSSSSSGSSERRRRRRGNRVTLMGIYPRSSASLMTPFRDAAAATGSSDDTAAGAAIKKFIAQEFKGAGWKTDLVIDGLLDPSRCAEFYAAEMVQLAGNLPSLYKGRVVLVGDAGYASGPTGMGTSLALAGGYILAGEVISRWNNTADKNENRDASLEEGLKAYEERMTRLVDEMARIPPLVPAVMAPYTAWGLWLRNEVFRLVCWSKSALDFMKKVTSRAPAFRASPVRHGAEKLDGENGDAGHDEDVGILPDYDFGELPEDSGITNDCKGRDGT